MTLLYEIILLFMMLALSAFFSGSETALVSISRLRVKHMVKQGKAGSRTLKKLKDDPKRLLITILICNNLANVTASALATLIAIKIFQNNAVSLAVGLMTFLLLIFGEITPKTFATHHNKRFSLLVAKPIYLLSIVLYPLVVFFDWIALMFMNLFGWEMKKTPVVTEAEIKTIVEMGEDAGAIKKIEEALIKNVFKFDDIEVEDIMVPKNKVFSLDANRKLKDVLSLILKTPYTRIPIYRMDPEHITGVILKSDILKKCVENKTDIPLRKMIRHVPFVLHTTKIDQLLKKFLSENVHMFIVLNEHHNLKGIVTLEDVLEELVGEITDEKEIEALKLKKSKKKRV
ncbi:MAG: hemolysin family protein [Nanoarchaeota archaeon]|nr:hemolysin family protein [Nanoarchaeota archaeon]